MRRGVTWLGIGLAAIVLATVAAVLVLPRLVETSRVRSLITTSASQALARPVKFQALSVSVLPSPTAHLHGLEVAEDPSFGGGPFITLGDAALRLKVWPLLRGHVEFATLVLKSPTIALVQAPDGRWNFATLGTARETTTAPARAPRGGGGGGPPATLVSRIVIDGGLVTYERRTAGGGPTRQRLENVDVTLTTAPGAVTFAGTARVVPGDVAVKITDGTLGVSGARTLADASVRAQLTLDAKDVGPVVASALGPEPSLAGALSGRLAVSGSVGRPHAAGEIEVRGPAVTRTSRECAEPRRRTLSLSTIKANVTWDDGRLVVQPLATGIGTGTITTRVVATAATPPQAEVSDLAASGIPVERVLVDFLCQGYGVTGLLDLTGTFTTTGAEPLRGLVGQGKLRIGAGKVVGGHAIALLRAGNAMAAALRLDPSFTPPLDFESIEGTYEIRHGVVTTRDLVYTSRTMKVKVAGDYALATEQVNLDVVVDDGRRQLQAKVTGSASSPAVRVAASMLPSIEPVKVERGLRDLLKKFR